MHIFNLILIFNLIQEKITTLNDTLSEHSRIAYAILAKEKKIKDKKLHFKLDFYTIKLEIGEIPDLKFFYHVEDSYELF